MVYRAGTCTTRIAIKTEFMGTAFQLKELWSAWKGSEESQNSIVIIAKLNIAMAVGTHGDDWYLG